ncbi:hypothetical protein [Actinoplanes sp. L3-i22]|uniref:hypothetical protein n=1 Tax=Actinoplanes sp. L3-i22 TaxID=2836373 RepID=UPI001C741F31|nr:hypothetical protein [Actinoplanes sp. L3-i22]BCY08174.1 hypothetical protein L3i22_032620 [Actinoplanes sp. L3-i22]
MSLRALFRRLLLPPLAAGLALSGLALPAHAESALDFPIVFLDLTESITVVDGLSKTVTFEMRNVGGGAAENVVIGFDSVPASLGFVPPAGCSATTCKISKLAAGERRPFSFTVKPATTSTSLTSSFHVTVAVEGEEMDDVEVQVIRTTKPGVDLEIGALPDVKLGRGESAVLPVTVRNTGNATSGTLGLAVAGQDTLEADLGRYRNCEPDAEVGGVICVLDDSLAPGETAALSAATPAKIKVKADAPGPAQYYANAVVVGLTDKYVAAFTKRNAGRTGDELKLQKMSSAASIKDDDVQDDLNPDDNVALFTVTTPTAPADSKAVGGVFQGAVGERVTAQIGMRNLGPFATVGLSTQSLNYVRVKLPSGVKPVTSDQMCLPGTSPTDVNFDGFAGRDWACLVLDQVPKGGKQMFTFTVEIEDGAHDGGYVQAYGGVQDTVHTNDKADLTVDTGASLPITGPSTGLLAAGGAILLAAGLFLFRATRRRRIITVAE